MKSLAKCLAALAMCSALVFGFAACSNGSDGTSVVVPNNGTQNGGTGTTTTTTTPTETGGGTTTPAVNPVVYTIILNANDGSPNPATVTQNFTAGVPQGLIPVEELGFSKSGFSFAGWGRAPKSTQSLYADGASYTATSNATLYALWSAIPVYSAKIASSEHGTLTATPAAAPAGTEITLSASPNEGYELASYTVTAADGTPVAVANGKFTMPEQDVTVSAFFNALNFTVTFNANDGSQSPATATQTFTAGTPQNLKTIAELGFSKSGFNFAGWLVSANDSEASYADGSVYTGTTDVTLYALWSAIPVYNVNTTFNERGTVAATPATGTAGTEITLFERPKTGYELASYTVTAADGTPVTVTNGKFAMPAQDVTVTANFSAISYTVTCGTFANGSVTASPATAIAGTEITLSSSPNAGYKFASYTVTAADGTAVAVRNGKFTMPAQNLNVTASFNAISYTVTCGSFANGSVSASPATATVGTSVTLTASPASGYELASLIVTGEGGTSVSVSGTGNSRTFEMPAKNVTVTATFNAIHYNISVGTIANGSVTASYTTATVGTLVTLTATPKTNCYAFGSFTVVDSNSNPVRVNAIGAFTMPAKNVTVSATFIPARPRSPYIVTGSQRINSISYDIVTFGSWPQTLKADGVSVDQNESLAVGELTYYAGSDGYWYAKLRDKYYKVEPIKWRVLDTRYNKTAGKKLLLTESVLIGKLYADYDNTGHTNSYFNSKIRKWLNSNSDKATNAVSDHGGSGGFLKSAFTAAEQSVIAETSVDNSARSTNPDANAEQWNNGRNLYAGGTVHETTDKVFLLSEQEVTTSAYGFDVYNAYKGDETHNESTRIRQTTDYAKASGANQSSTAGLGGWWWLRSPYYDHYQCADVVLTDGSAAENRKYVYYNYGGVVPALCVKD